MESLPPPTNTTPTDTKTTNTIMKAHAQRLSGTVAHDIFNTTSLYPGQLSVL